MKPKSGRKFRSFFCFLIFTRCRSQARDFGFVFINSRIIYPFLGTIFFQFLYSNDWSKVYTCGTILLGFVETTKLYEIHRTNNVCYSYPGYDTDLRSCLWFI